MSLYDQLSEIAEREMLDYFGIADLSDPQAQAFITDQNKFAAGFPRAVSVGAVISSTLADLLPEADESVRGLYKYHLYTVTAARIDRASALLTRVLERAGYRALIIPAAVVSIDRERMAGVFSHKLAANRAGHGWIGKSCMLITPEHGPRVTWGTVLTDAPLAAAGAAMAPQCGNCRACVDQCPAHAYTGRMFDPAEPRSMRYDVMACRRYMESIPAAGPETRTCGLCLQACPHGRR